MTDHPHDDYSTGRDLAPSLTNHLQFIHATDQSRLQAMTVLEMVALHDTEHLPSPGISRFDIHLGTLNDMDGILALVTGYRAKCEAAGFGEDTAELMAAHLHQAICFRIGTTTLEDPDDGR
jgi:hypothetical protein